MHWTECLFAHPDFQLSNQQWHTQNGDTIDVWVCFSLWLYLLWSKNLEGTILQPSQICNQAYENSLTKILEKIVWCMQQIQRGVSFATISQKRMCVCPKLPGRTYHVTNCINICMWINHQRYLGIPIANQSKIYTKEFNQIVDEDLTSLESINSFHDFSLNTYVVCYPAVLCWSFMMYVRIIVCM